MTFTEGQSTWPTLSGSSRPEAAFPEPALAVPVVDRFPGGRRMRRQGSKYGIRQRVWGLMVLQELPDRDGVKRGFSQERPGACRRFEGVEEREKGQ